MTDLRTPLIEERRDIERKLAFNDATRKRLQAEISIADRERTSLAKRKSEIEAALDRTPKTPQVTDHAVLRFLERRYHFDADAIRAEIMTPTMEQAILFGAEAVKAHGGKFVIKDGKVVTFLGGDMR